jgi:hypothetical protein
MKIQALWTLSRHLDIRGDIREEFVFVIVYYYSFLMEEIGQ